MTMCISWISHTLPKLLRQPFPLISDAGASARIAAYIALFVLVFLWLFQPFGLNDDEIRIKYLLISGYAAVTFLVLIANLLLVPKLVSNVFVEERWTVFREILWELWNVISVGTGIYLFFCLVGAVSGYFRPGFVIFLLFQFMTFIIAMFPVTAVVVFKGYLLLRKNADSAVQICSALKDPQSRPGGHEYENDAGMVKIVADGGRKYDFDIESLVYMSSEGNYSNVFYREEKVESVMIRSSLTNIEKQLEAHPFLFRCHRSFIVNLRKIENAEGNAQGIRLSLEGVDRRIKVARSYYKDFRMMMGIS